MGTRRQRSGIAILRARRTCNRALLAMGSRRESLKPLDEAARRRSGTAISAAHRDTVGSHARPVSGLSS
jgi:hypothetical protein